MPTLFSTTILTGALTFSLTTNASTPTALNPQKKLNAFTEGERLIYTRVVEAFHKNALPEAIRERDRLAKNYPHSVHLDNAFYLTGVLQFQKQNLAEAARDFGVVVDHFPQSNKRPAALFAKAATYSKLGLQPLASKLWDQIVKEYPGSQESQRAWAQLRVTKNAKVK